MEAASAHAEHDAPEPMLSAPVEAASATQIAGEATVVAALDRSALLTERNVDQPVPMHLPAILVNPRVKHLQGRSPVSASPKSRKGPMQTKAVELVGRRKILRHENARMLSNPHVVRPTLRDFNLPHPNPAKVTVFPAGSSAGVLKPPSTSSIHASAPSFEPASAQCGQYSLSLRDANRVLSERLGVQVGPTHRDNGQSSRGLTPAQHLIMAAEKELLEWLHPRVYIVPETAAPSAASKRRVVVTADFDVLSDATASDLQAVDVGIPQLMELSRQPHAIVWALPDPFLRLAVHCLARVYGCPSFSKETRGGGPRQTWILNPNPLARTSRRRMGRRQASAGDTGSESDRASMVASSSLAPSMGAPRGRTDAIRSQAALGTPPTTDVGTDVDAESVLWDSESELVGSVILTNPGSDQADIDNNEGAEDADVTLLDASARHLSVLVEAQESDNSEGIADEQSWQDDINDDDDEDWEADLDSDAASTSELGESLSGSLPDLRLS